VTTGTCPSEYILSDRYSSTEPVDNLVDILFNGSFQSINKVLCLNWLNFDQLFIKVKKQ